MQQPAANNPLSQFFRQIKFYMKLPSGTSYYTSDVVEFNHVGEIGVMPMTGQDELTLKNPDALLNGEALISVIQSCAPAVKDPKKLLINDIDAIITAIRAASYGDNIESSIVCPACDHENTFKVNVQYALESMSFLDAEYVINLDSGLSLYIAPYKFTESMKALHAQFEQNKLAKIMESDVTEEEKRIQLGITFKILAKTNFDLICSSVVKIVNESAGINVTNPEHITEFVRNTDSATSTAIEKLIQTINKIGIEREFKATCEKCSHTWTSEIDFNPVNFL